MDSNENELFIKSILKKTVKIIAVLICLVSLVYAQDPLSDITANANKSSEDKKIESPAKAPSADTEEGDQQELEVVLGIDKVLKLDYVPFSKLNIGNPTILDYQIVPQKKEIVFKGLKPGQTSVIIRDTVGDIKTRLKINLTTNAQSQVVNELKEYLGEIEGLNIGIKGGKVYIGGEIIVPGQIGVINTVMEKYPDVLQLYELSPQTQRVIAQKMQIEIQKAGLKDVSVRIVNKIYWLEGVVTGEGDKDLAMKIAEAYLPDIQISELAGQSGRAKTISRRNPILNFISINPAKQKPQPPPKLVKIIAQFVELTKDYNKIFGFKWTPTLSNGGGNIQFGKTVNNGVTTKSNGTFSGTIANLFPQLASAKSAGYARVIQQGMVIVKDRAPQGATIQKTSNVPFSLGTGEFTKAANVETGFVLNVKAGILPEDKIDLGVGLDVSMAHGSNGSTKNKIQTSVVVKSKESAVVGGISINESQTSYDKDPPFGQDQVNSETGSPLFSFLRSKSYSISKSQFVVFLTPEIVETVTAATNEIRSKFRQRRR
jgi:pilus assembly protein CpaC